MIKPFLQLPSASEYPDYYESIEKPIDMSIIKDRIDKGQVNQKKNYVLKRDNEHFIFQYKREQDLVDDLNLMFKNAKTYNVDESYIYKNACQLQTLLSNKHKKLMNKKEKFIQNLAANRPNNQGIIKK